MVAGAILLALLKRAGAYMCVFRIADRCYYCGAPTSYLWGLLIHFYCGYLLKSAKTVYTFDFMIFVIAERINLNEFKQFKFL